ncbi:MAG: YlbF family regulator [Clostridia bacterium]|nr:YlbF family regulator [Clostridia bacterium]
MEYSKAYALADEIKASEEYRTCHSLREAVTADETTAALIREYKKLSVRLQMAAVNGTQADQEDIQRFSGINAVLFARPDVTQYLLAEMRLQQAMADIFRILTDAAGLEMPGFGE